MIAIIIILFKIMTLLENQNKKNTWKYKLLSTPVCRRCSGGSSGRWRFATSRQEKEAFLLISCPATSISPSCLVDTQITLKTWKQLWNQPNLSDSLDKTIICNLPTEVISIIGQDETDTLFQFLSTLQICHHIKACIWLLFCPTRQLLMLGKKIIPLL